LKEPISFAAKKKMVSEFLILVYSFLILPSHLQSLHFPIHCMASVNMTCTLWVSEQRRKIWVNYHCV